MHFADKTIGTCGLCGGPVTVPSVWLGVIPPVPTCGKCGATQRLYGPILDMAPPGQTWVSDRITAAPPKKAGT